MLVRIFTSIISIFAAIMEWLEVFKKQHKDNEAITNEIVAQAHLENYALRLFNYADQQDRAANFQKLVIFMESLKLPIDNYFKTCFFFLFFVSRNVVKSYYTAGMIYDVLVTFGELGEEATHNRKYSKYKAAYIHNCLKNGETPVPGPHTEDDGGEEKDDNEDVVVRGPSEPTGGSGQSEQPSPPPDSPQTPHINVDLSPADISGMTNI